MTGRVPSLRPATPEDEGFLRTLYGSTRSDELAALDGSSEQKAAFVAMQFEARARAYSRSYPDAENAVVLVDGEPVGSLVVHRSEHEVRIIDIALVPGWRGRGLGTSLLDALLDEGRRTGRPVRDHVAKDNARAFAWYRRLGFSVVEDRGLYWFLERLPEAGQVNTAS